MRSRAQARKDDFAWHAAQRRECQPPAGGDHCAGVALGDCRRPALCNVPEQFLELVSGLRCEDDPVVDQALEVDFLVCFACVAAIRALTAPTATACDGCAFSLS